MKIMGFPRQVDPNRLCLAMAYMIKNKFEKKIRFGGYTKRPYKDVRRLFKILWKKDLEDYVILDKYLNKKLWTHYNNHQ